MRKWLVAVVLLALWASPASASRTTYTRRFVNRTSVPVGLYRLDGASWVFLKTLWPGIPEVEREVPKRTDFGRTIFGMDLGMDGRAVDLARNDFGTSDFRWIVSEDFPR